MITFHKSVTLALAIPAGQFYRSFTYCLTKVAFKMVTHVHRR